MFRRKQLIIMPCGIEPNPNGKCDNEFQGWNDRWRESEGMCRRPDDTSNCRSSFSTHNSLNLSGRSVNLITQTSHVVVPVQHGWKESLSSAPVQHMIQCFSPRSLTKIDFASVDLQVAPRPDLLKTQFRHIPVNKVYVAPTMQ